jgi:Mg2+ and Co2+ transporter CorA
MEADAENGLNKVEANGLNEQARPALKVPPMKDVRPPGLELAPHRINPDATLSDCELEEALESIDRDDDDPSKPKPPAYWVDTEVDNLADNLKELRTTILDKLPLSTFVKRHLTSEQMQKTQVLSLQKTCVCVFRILTADDDSTKMRYATVVCIRGLLLTIHIVSPKLDLTSHGVRLLNQDAVANMMQRELPIGTTTGVLSVWLLFHLNQVSNEAHKLRKRIFELAEKMDNNIACVSLSEIVEVKDQVLRILAVAEEQNEAMVSLAEGDNVTSAIDYENLKGFKGVLLSSASSTERMTLRLEKRVQDLRQSYDAHQQDRINHRLAVLTVLSSIFLPLSFMAGIWGMNFDNMYVFESRSKKWVGVAPFTHVSCCSACHTPHRPELHRENSYFFAISGMFTLACSFLCVFWRYGWFE